MTYLTASSSSTKTNICRLSFNTERKPTPKPVVFGFVGAVFALMASAPNQAFAITHGCTQPTGVPDFLTIDMDFDGKTSPVSGGYCEAIGKAKAAIAKSRLPEKGKQSALEQLKKLQVQVVTKNTAAGRRVKFSLTVKCTVGKPNCTVGAGLTF